VTVGAIDPAAFANLVEITGGDLEFVDELVDTYLADGVNQVAALEAAAATGSSEDLVRPAHAMKSSSLNVGALELGGLCRELEEAARIGPVPDAGARVAAIATAFEVVRDDLLDERRSRSPG
jgi:HPt (histidine-containing phosphotransfer) domain-containing protein